MNALQSKSVNHRLNELIERVDKPTIAPFKMYKEDLRLQQIEMVCAIMTCMSILCVACLLVFKY